MKVILYFFFISAFIGCSIITSDDSKIIRIKGSDTMLMLNKKLAEKYMQLNPGISIYVDGGGTKTGVSALINNSIEICAASRPLEPVEIKQLGEQFNTVGMSFLIGRDALSIFVNPKNPVRNITSEQLRQIYLCEITNWEEIGGNNRPIQPISRSGASGTYLYLRKHVLKGDEICRDIKIANTTREIIDFVRINRNSIGYGGIEFGDSSMLSRIDNIMPTKENVLNNSYPILRYLRYYTSRKPSGNTKEFIDWVISEEGQKIVSSMGYFSLWE